MRKIVLFVEDYGHEAFIDTLIKRLAAENGIEVRIDHRSVRGGHGKVITEYAEDIVNAMDLQRIDDKSLERFCKELQSKFKAWV